MKKQIHEYYEGDTLLKGYLSYDDSQTSPLPAVLICPDYTGRNTFAENKADEMVKLGYVGFVIDVYGHGKQGKTPDEKSALMTPFIQDRILLRQRLLAAFDTVRQFDFVDKHKIAVMGFCFGGLCALDLARSGADIKGAVSFHGLFLPLPHAESKTIKAKILALHGYDDPMVPPDQVNHFANEMTKAKADWQIHMYGHTQHAFTNPVANDPHSGIVYNSVAAKRSWQAMKDFFEEILKSPATNQGKEDLT